MPDFIDGIYNYCDRWCERCPLTARCRQFAMEQLMNRRTDIQNAEFWKELDLNLEVNPELDALLADALEEMEEDKPLLEIPFDAEESIVERSERNPLVQSAFDYAMAVRKWLDAKNLWHSRRPSDNPGSIDRDDALDIIEWYSTLIAAKLGRAASGQVELDDDDPFGIDADEEFDSADDFDSLWPEDDESSSEEDDSAVQEGDTSPISDEDALWEDDRDQPWEDDFSRTLRDAHRSDRDGSAKVALIGIERSLGALTLLRRELPAEEPTIRQLLQHLARLRVELDRRWPGARTFVRPGFDDE